MNMARSETTSILPYFFLGNEASHLRCFRRFQAFGESGAVCPIRYNRGLCGNYICHEDRWGEVPKVPYGALVLSTYFWCLFSTSPHGGPQVEHQRATTQASRTSLQGTDYLESQWPRIMAYFESIMGYFESIMGYFQSIMGYFQSMMGCFQSMMGYFQSMMGYFQSMMGYFQAIMGYFGA